MLCSNTFRTFFFKSQNVMAKGYYSIETLYQIYFQKTAIYSAC